MLNGRLVGGDWGKTKVTGCRGTIEPT